MFGDRLLVDPEPVEERTKGGLVIPDIVKTRSHRGRVVAVGPGCERIRIGDRALCSFWAAAHIRLDGREYHLYLEKDVFGVLDSEEPIAHGDCR